MIRIVNKPAGLSFKQWCAALMVIPNDATIGSFYLDLEEDEIHWMEYLLQFRITMKHGAMQKGRGIGSCDSPQYIILIPQIHHQFKTTWDYDMWHLPQYETLRPFNENKL